MTSVTLLHAFTVIVLTQTAASGDPAPHRAQLVTVADGVQVEVLDFGGVGRPLVLLAGLGNTAHVFDELAPKLTGLGRVFAITRRGYGASSRTTSGYDVARLGKDVLAVLDSLRIERPVLIGHSMAGQEMSYLAEQYPDRIGALVYLEAAYRYAFDLPGEFERAFPTLPRPPATLPRIGRQPHTLPEAERRQPADRRPQPRRSAPAGDSSSRSVCRRWRSSPAPTTLAQQCRTPILIDSIKRSPKCRRARSNMAFLARAYCGGRASATTYFWRAKRRSSKRWHNSSPRCLSTAPDRATVQEALSSRRSPSDVRQGIVIKVDGRLTH